MGSSKLESILADFMARKGSPPARRQGAVQARFPGPLTTAEFLRRHWQKRPLVVRGAFPDFVDPLSVAEVLALAQSPDAESRIVRRAGRHWSLAHGPFTRAQLARRPRRDWTVLVQDSNHFSDRATALLARFAFVPHARMFRAAASDRTSIPTTSSSSRAWAGAAGSGPRSATSPSFPAST
jgi:hypothetical protein